MGVGPSEPKHTTFYARHFLRAPANTKHIKVHREAHGRLWVMGPEREESRRVIYILVFVWSPRSER